jgi:hypothetical protein
LEKTKEKIGKLKKKFEKKIILKKKEEESTVDYCCNPHYFVCEGTVIPPHDLDIVVKKIDKYNFEK